MTGRREDFTRPLLHLARQARATLRDAARQTTQPEETTSSRADAAYQEEFDKWRGLIEAAAGDLGLSRDQRAAGVIALRARQQAAATAIRRRVIEEEKQTAKARRRAAYRSRPPLSRAHAS